MWIVIGLIIAAAIVTTIMLWRDDRHDEWDNW
jgi:hypothetical protein